MFEIIGILLLAAIACAWVLQWLSGPTIPKGDDPPNWPPARPAPPALPRFRDPLVPAADKKPWESEYTDDWRQVSREYRKSKRWICEGCGVNLSRHRRLLHAHHHNMDKSDNSPSNLRAYCVICHSEQPYHDKLRVSIRIKGEYDEVISIRHSQGIR